MGYSEKELLMLSNFVYLDVSKNEGTISEILAEYRNSDGTFTKESVSDAGTGGGLDSEQVSELFTQMQKQCDEKGSSFGELSASRRLEESDVRGICYTDASDKNPVVVFRGTGGTKEAWQDNMYGGFKVSTRLQQEASDFVKYECGTYSDIVVTGHSKGGNLSQYVTVMNGDKISSCVSFDGQGMNKDFIRQNSEAVVSASSKIKSISAYNDFVNILLTGIAGTVLYVNNDEGGVNAHSSFFLLKSNEYDSNGNFTSGRKQSPVAESMKRVVDRIVEVMGLGSDADNIIIGGILGEAVATMVMAPDAEGIKNGLDNAASEAMLAFSVKMNSMFDSVEMEIRSLPSGGVYFDYDNVKNVSLAWDDSRVMTENCIRKTEDIIGNMDINIASKFYADMALSRAVNNMRKNTETMIEMVDIINASLRKYEDQEAMTALRMKCLSS